MSDKTNREKLIEIVKTQIDKLYKMSQTNCILTDREIRSITELSKTLVDIEKLDEVKEAELDKLSNKELLAIAHYRSTGKWPNE